VLCFVHRSSAGGCFGSSAALLRRLEQPEQSLVTPVCKYYIGPAHRRHFFDERRRRRCSIPADGRARFAVGLRGFHPGWKNRDPSWRTSPKIQQGSHFDPPQLTMAIREVRPDRRQY